VIYKTGIREVYYFEVRRRKLKRGDNCFVVTPQSATIKEDLPLYKEFEDGPLDNSVSYHWRINRNQFEEATLLEQRIAMHRLLRKLMATKSEPDWYPEQVLESDWEYLRTCDFNRYFVDGSFACYPRTRRKPAHFRITEHYFNPSTNLSRVALWAAVCETCNKKTVPLNSSSIRKMARWAERRRVLSPLVYCAIFKALKITGAVADLHPGRGAKAIACAIMGLPYFAAKNERMKRAIDLGIASFLRMDFEWFNKQKVELLISDNNFDSFVMPTGEKLNQANKMLCFVPYMEKTKMVSRLNPTAILQIHSWAELALTLQNPNYLFLW
jgi:hypothetical protein